MPQPPKIYEDYLALAHKADLEFLHQEDQLPIDTSHTALWRDRPSGVVFKQSFQRIQQKVNADEPVTREQAYRKEYLDKYPALAEALGIEFIYDPTVDVAPTSTKDPVKWRNLGTDQVVIASFADLAYANKSPTLLRELGIDPDLAASFDYRKLDEMVRV